MILLYPGITVSGTVRQAVTGESIAGVRVRLTAGGEGADPTRWFRDDAVRIATDDMGRFSIPSVPTSSGCVITACGGCPYAR